jgi:hypothetical protein
MFVYHATRVMEWLFAGVKSSCCGCLLDCIVVVCVCYTLRFFFVKACMQGFGGITLKLVRGAIAFPGGRLPVRHELVRSLRVVLIRVLDCEQRYDWSFIKEETLAVTRHGGARSKLNGERHDDDDTYVHGGRAFLPYVLSEALHQKTNCKVHLEHALLLYWLILKKTTDTLSNTTFCS